MADPERDERVSANYRALGREEPSAALDAAILAAARRRGPRWGVPVSIAAVLVLVLAAGVTLRMQQERPDAETAVPAPQALKERRTAPSTRENTSRAAADAVAPTFAPAPSVAAQGRSSSEVVAKTAEEAPARAAAPGVADVASAPPASAALQFGARKESAAKQTEEVLAPEAWLERIAAMRKAGRVKEADERYAAFKRKYPDYRIPEAMLGKVAPAQ